MLSITACASATGAGGTSGLGEPAVDVTQNLFSTGTLVVPGGCIGYLSAPVDPVQLRAKVADKAIKQIGK